MTPGNDRQDLIVTSSPLRGRTDLAIRRTKMYVALNLTRLRLLLELSWQHMIFKKQKSCLHTGEWRPWKCRGPVSVGKHARN